LEKDTRAKLIETAAPLFARKGFAAVSVRELAQAAGANVAAISYHFGSKEGLYQSVLEEQFAPIDGLLKKMPEVMAMSGEARLRFYADNIVSIHRQRPYFIRIMTSEMTNPTVCFYIIKRHIFQVFRFLHQALQDGIAAGEFRADLHVALAVPALAGIMNFLFIGRAIAKEFLPLSAPTEDEYATQAFAIYLNGIRRQDHE
jgi:Transcriptional regulator